MDDTWDNVQKMIEGSAECKEELESKLESKLGKRTKILFKYLKHIGLLGGGILAFFLFNKWLHRELDGCYQYTGTDSQKIGCPNTGTFFSPSDDAKKYCNCGKDATPNLYIS